MFFPFLSADRNLARSGRETKQKASARFLVSSCYVLGITIVMMILFFLKFQDGSERRVLASLNETFQPDQLPPLSALLLIS